MKKISKNTAFLTPGISSAQPLQTTGRHLLLLKEQKENLVENVSKLYQLFFGSPLTQQEIKKEVTAASEPDYYSSYE
jgi:hypothetical protein